MKVSLEWNGIKKGDAVQILSPSGIALRGTFRFEAHCVTDAGTEWVNVYGGTITRKGVKYKMRSVTTDRVRLDRRKQATRGSRSEPSENPGPI